MSDIDENLTMKATASNNVFEEYYQDYLKYSKNKLKNKELENNLLTIDEKYQNIAKEYDNHVKNENKIISNYSNNIENDCKNEINNEYQSKIEGAKKEIDEQKNELSNLSDGSIINKQDLYNKIYKEHMVNFTGLNRIENLANHNIANYEKILSKNDLDNVLNETSNSFKSELTFELLETTLYDTPDEFYFKEKEKKKAYFFRNLLKPSFLNSRVKTQKGTYRQDGAVQFNPLRAIIYWVILAAIVLLLLTTYVGIMLLILIIIGLIVAFILNTIYPKYQAKQSFKNNSKFYFAVKNFNSLFEYLVDEEVNDKLSNQEAYIEETKIKINKNINDLESKINHLNIEWKEELSSLDQKMINEDAKEKYEDVKIQLEDIYKTIYDDKINVEKNQNIVKTNIEKFVEKEQTYYVENFKGNKGKDRDAIEKEQKEMIEKTSGRIWDSIYIFDKNVDDNNIQACEKIKHDLKPIVLLYSDTECGEENPSKVFAEIINKIILSIYSKFPPKFIKTFLVDYQGSGRDYKEPIINIIKKESELKDLNNALENNDAKVKDENIAIDNMKLLKNKDSVINYILSIFFIPNQQTDIHFNGLQANGEIIRAINQKGRTGFLPIFLLDKEEWINCKNEESKNKCNTNVLTIRKQCSDSSDNVFEIIDAKNRIIKKFEEE